MPTMGHPTGAFPVVQPNGRLVVLFREGGVDQRADAATAIPPWTFTATSSADGGRTFGVIRTLVTRVKPYFPHYVRAFATTIPSVGVDARGRLYAVWQTCRFRNPCSGNDLVLSTSANGRSWTRPRRLPLGASGDRIVPGLAVAPGRRGQPVRPGSRTTRFATAPALGCAASSRPTSRRPRTAGGRGASRFGSSHQLATRGSLRPRRGRRSSVTTPRRHTSARSRMQRSR